MLLILQVLSPYQIKLHNNLSDAVAGLEPLLLAVLVMEHINLDV